MSAYTIYNMVLAVIVLPLGTVLLLNGGTSALVLAAARVALLVTLIAFPWDFFAIQFGAWQYPNDPGPRIYGVPVNDLAFIWLCTFLTCSVLVAFRRRESGGHRHTEREDTGQEDAADQ